MNIMFMTKFPNGKPTEFVSKILQCFYDNPFRIAKLHAIDIDPCLPAKCHTIRQSKRVKQGMKLSLCNWSEKPYRSPQIEFAKTECFGTQDITIFRVHKKLRVWIDDKLLSDEVVSQLAINDGFDSAEEFIEYFKKGFIGQIIHWTDLLY